MTSTMAPDTHDGSKAAEKVRIFIDNRPFLLPSSTTTARTLLVEYAQEDPTQTVLKLRQGRELIDFPDLDLPFTIKNGDHFTVLHTGPTPVS